MSVSQNSSVFFQNLKKFVIDNSIIGTTAGFCVAIVTKDVIQSLVSDIIIPALSLLLFSLNIKSIHSILPGKLDFDYINFVKQFITWVLVLIITFLFIKYAFMNLLGVKDNEIENKTDNKTDNKIYKTDNGTDIWNPNYK